jgi:hypothetical protein
MFTFKHSATAALAALLALSSASNAIAATHHWQHKHPRRAEVNARLNHQDKRIHQERKAGEISPAKAKTLHREDRSVRANERAMAVADKGHIAKPEQRALNQQENGVGKQLSQ